MTLSLAALSRNAACDAIVDRCDVGGAGTIEIRTGAKPATADDAATGTVLATIPLAATAFGAAAAGVATLQGTPLTDIADATGTAGWARVKSGGGAAVFDGTVTATGGGGDFTLATTSVVTGATVRITAGTVTMPA